MQRMGEKENSGVDHVVAIPLLVKWVKSDEDVLDRSRQAAAGDGRVTVKPFRSCPALLLLLALVLVLVQVLVLVLGPGAARP